MAADEAEQPAASGSLVISGAVVIGAEQQPFTRAVLNLYLEEVARQDVAATRLAAWHLPVPGHQLGNETRLPFMFAAPPEEAGARYVIRAHVAMHDGTTVMKGDKVSTIHNPIAPGIAQRDILIQVEDVR